MRAYLSSNAVCGSEPAARRGRHARAGKGGPASPLCICRCACAKMLLTPPPTAECALPRDEARDDGDDDEEGSPVPVTFPVAFPVAVPVAVPVLEADDDDDDDECHSRAIAASRSLDADAAIRSNTTAGLSSAEPTAVEASTAASNARFVSPKISRRKWRAPIRRDSGREAMRAAVSACDSEDEAEEAGVDEDEEDDDDEKEASAVAAV
jgi:hypothetical protein